MRAAVTARLPDAQQLVIREAVQFDVARSLIIGALRSDVESWDAAAADEGSVAAVVNRLIGVVFPTETLDGLRGRLAATPQRLEVRMQDGLRLFREVAGQ